jgi:hypothetical protein
MGIALWAQNQDHNNDREKGEKMRCYEDAFSKRKVLGAKYVEGCNSKGSCENQERRLPSGWSVCVFMVDDNQALDNETDEPAIQSNNTLPRDGGKPT